MSSVPRKGRTACPSTESTMLHNFFEQTLRVRQTARKSKFILIVEDDENVSKMLKSLITNSGLECEIANSIKSALLCINTNGAESIRTIVVDLHLPDGDGEDLITYIEKEHPDIPFVIHSGDIPLARKIQKKHVNVTSIEKTGKIDKIISALGLDLRFSNTGTTVIA